MKHYIWEVEVSLLDYLVIVVNVCLVGFAMLLCLYAAMCRGKRLTGVIQPFPLSYLDDSTPYKFYRTTDPKVPNRRRQLVGKGRKDKSFIGKDELECTTCKTKVPVEISPY